MMHRLILILVLWSLPALGQNGVQRFEKSIATLTVTKQPWSIGAPWARAAIARHSYLATMVRENLFLTSAEALADAKMVELQRYGSAYKHKASVVFIDYEANLAVVRFADSKIAAGMAPLALGELELPLMSRVQIVHGVGDRLFGRNGEVRSIEMRGGKTSPYPFPAYSIELADGNGFGGAEPVMRRGKLVGLTTSRKEGLVYALPGMIIKHFLDDDFDAKGYRGFPFVGISSRQLLSPDLRGFLGVTVEGGIRVTAVLENSPFKGSILTDDVIVAIDGVNIDARGHYVHKPWGKIFFSNLISRKYAGDMLKIAVIRQGKLLSISRRMARYDRNSSLLAYYQPDIEKVPHLIFGGLIFQELSRSYLQKWGDSWMTKAPDRLLFYWYYRNDPPKKLGHRQLILNRVLSDRFNRGHQKVTNAVLERVNGQEVRTIAELRTALLAPIKRREEDFAVFEFGYGITDVILSYRDLDKAHQRIAASYSIKTTDSFLNGF